MKKRELIRTSFGFPGYFIIFSCVRKFCLVLVILIWVCLAFRYCLLACIYSDDVKKYSAWGLASQMFWIILHHPLWPPLTWCERTAVNQFCCEHELSTRCVLVDWTMRVIACNSTVVECRTRECHLCLGTCSAWIWLSCLWLESLPTDCALPSCWL